MCLASPIIPAAARSVSLQIGIVSAVENCLLASVLRLTANINTIRFSDISWDNLPQEVLDVLCSYPLTKILLNNVVIPSIPSFSFFRRCTTRVLVDLHISGMLRIGNTAEEQAVNVASNDKPVAIRSLSLWCPGTARRAIRAILLSPSSPFHLRILANVVMVFTLTGKDGIGSERDAILLRDLISSSSSQELRTVRSSFDIRAPPSFILRFPPATRQVSFTIATSPLQMIPFRSSAVLRWWIDSLLRSECYGLEQLTIFTTMLLGMWVMDDEALDAWAHLDDELSSSNYSKVKAVHIGIEHRVLFYNPAHRANAADILTKCLPRLAKKGVLKLVCGQLGLHGQAPFEAQNRGTEY
ncbi:uncharacterized protein EV420DRAFT_1565971 [Desarmillaria tabescens]|uniref:Uncharacterized protein n=1 Tax=Armillaria tabescens TaxID=1929756 RepID=A0AA39JW49_ARMTA|nr:uncharacterized protein EV420DRAFT_1565971 [Desarmillaria tabescens]KAK0448886.1 hypothetical protein EV420DRAFT_1565971 [Desarmillaria tabescens]